MRRLMTVAGLLGALWVGFAGPVQAQLVRPYGPRVVVVQRPWGWRYHPRPYRWYPPGPRAYRERFGPAAAWRWRLHERRERAWERERGGWGPRRWRPAI